MNAYYSRLEDLRAKLIAAGEEDWARDLLQGERSATTSGEALSNTGVILRRLLEGDAVDRLGLRDTVQSIYDEGGLIWGGGR